MAAAHDFRQNHARDWWRLQWYKFRHFWTPWLNPLIFSRATFLISLLTVTPLFLLAPVELFRRRRSKDPFVWVLLGLIAVGYLVGGLLFHVQVRYRFPFVDMAFIVLTASLLGRLRLVELLKSKWPRLLPQLAPSPVVDSAFVRQKLDTPVSLCRSVPDIESLSIPTTHPNPKKKTFQ
jgi:hypothetical protein